MTDSESQSQSQIPETPTSQRNLAVEVPDSDFLRRQQIPTIDTTSYRPIRGFAERLRARPQSSQVRTDVEVCGKQEREEDDEEEEQEGEDKEKKSVDVLSSVTERVPSSLDNEREEDTVVPCPQGFSKEVPGTQIGVELGKKDTQSQAAKKREVEPQVLQTMDANNIDGRKRRESTVTTFYDASSATHYNDNEPENEAIKVEHDGEAYDEKVDIVPESDEEGDIICSSLASQVDKDYHSIPLPSSLEPLETPRQSRFVAYRK